MGPISSSQSRLENRRAERPIVAVVEDNPADLLVIRDAIALSRLDLDLQVFEDGEKAIEMIAGLDADDAAHCPRLILLDLNLPRADGFEVLEKLRNSARCRHIPVVIMTSSAAPSDCDKSTALGANGYFQKPSQYDAFLRIGDIVREHLERPD